MNQTYFPACNIAAAEFDKWVKANGKRLEGLVARRDKEEALFRRDLPREPVNG